MAKVTAGAKTLGKGEELEYKYGVFALSGTKTIWEMRLEK